MFCPLCISEQLDMTFRSGIEVDVCPRCRGVWLDRGELDRLAEGAVHTPPPPLAAHRIPPPAPPVGWTKPERPDVPRTKKKRKRKKGFNDRLDDLFEELFDIFD